MEFASRDPSFLRYSPRIYLITVRVVTKHGLSSTSTMVPRFLTKNDKVTSNRPPSEKSKLPQKSHQTSIIHVRAISARAQFILYTVTPYNFTQNVSSRISFLVHQPKVSQAQARTRCRRRRREARWRKRTKETTRERTDRHSPRPYSSPPLSSLPAR
jgi:hypothetical protein